MTPDLDALVVAAYVFPDEYPGLARSGPAAKMSGRGVGGVSGCKAAMGITSDHRFLGLVGLSVAGLVSWHLPSQS